MTMADYWCRTARSGNTGSEPSFSDAELDDVNRFYADAAPPTRLVRLAALAADLGLAEVLVKDESSRFGLPAFKIAGVRYAVDRLLREAEAPVTTLACATSGNHGRAVARTARLRGLDARVYVPAGTAASRVAALAEEGADVVACPAGYDDAVRRMRRDAAAHGWTIVSDTGWNGYTQVPRWIMAGYTRLLQEAATEWGPTPPDLVIVQAGVGSLAGGAAGWLARRHPSGPPSLVIAEPVGSSCVRASLDAGRRVDLIDTAPTDMVGLRCGEVSPVAWPLIHATATAAIGVTDADTRTALAIYRRPMIGDPVIASAASGAASLGALIALVRVGGLAGLRDRLGVSRDTRVLVFNTEGRTD